MGHIQSLPDMFITNPHGEKLPISWIFSWPEAPGGVQQPAPNRAMFFGTKKNNPFQKLQTYFMLVMPDIPSTKNHRTKIALWKLPKGWMNVPRKHHFCCIIQLLTMQWYACAWPRCSWESMVKCSHSFWPFSCDSLSSGLLGAVTGNQKKPLEECHWMSHYHWNMYPIFKTIMNVPFYIITFQQTNMV